MPTHEIDYLPPKENYLAAEMLQAQLGASALSTQVEMPRGNSADGYMLNTTELGGLTNAFRVDPAGTLGAARKSMLKVIEGRTGPTRRSTLEPYLDSYLNLTVKLDNAAFPTEPTVQTTIPDYVPDGLVDYGRSFPSKREPIVVDKRAILEKNKPILTEIFSRDYTGMNEVQIKTAMVSALTEHVYTSMPYGDKSVDQGGNLSEATETLCRHHALTLQVLCQTIGVESRLFKGELNGSGHGANFVRLGGKWWLVDATQPDFSRAANGSEQWNPAAFEVEGPPYQGTRVYNVHSRYGGPDRQYIAADRMNWTIR